MRPVLVLALLLVLPAATAQVTWLAPEQAYAGHPVEVAWLAADDQDAPLAHHVQATMEVWSNGTLVQRSASIHEHDGLHTMTVTPRDAGPLRFVAEVDGVRHEAVVEVLPSERRLSGVPWEDWLDLRLEMDEEGRIVHRGYHENGHVHWTHGTYTALEDEAGRAYAVAPFPLFRDGPSGTARAWYTAPTYTGHPTPVMGLRTSSMEVPAAERGSGLLTPMTGDTDCPGLVLDPPPPQGLLAGHQPWTDLRIAYLPGDAESGPRDSSVPMRLVRTTPTEAAIVGQYRATGVVHEITLRPGVGDYRLDVDNGACRVPLRVVPFEGSDAPGRLEATFEVAGTNVTGVFSAQRGDEELGHYEFDTWVYREDPRDGRLVWRGKMHGHDGPVSFSLHDLEPGTYGVRVYPSPQDQGVPPVAAEGPDGFLWSFEVQDAEVQSVVQESPLPFLLALGLVVFAVARRR